MNMLGGVLLPYEFLLEQNIKGMAVYSDGVLLPYEFLLEQNLYHNITL